jgi:sarcosine oxidase
LGIGRRKFVKSLAAAGVALASNLPDSLAASLPPTEKSPKSYDVAVVGAGVFGAWTARELQRSGQQVILLDQYGPANSRSSSGGETRIIRMGYGAKEFYTRWSWRSLAVWKEFFARTGQPLFLRTGVLWMADENDSSARTPGVRRAASAFAETAATLEKVGVPYEMLSRSELQRRFPQIAAGPSMIGLFEPESGALVARRAVQAVAADAVRNGVDYFAAAVVPPAGRGRLAALTTREGSSISAEKFVFACGPWLPRIFPELLGEKIVPTRGEEFFFGRPGGDVQFAPPAMPTWIDTSTETFGTPDIESRGFKVGIDLHGPSFDPDRDSRLVMEDSLNFARAFLAQRFPALKDAPLLENRVCQYENTTNEDFLVDRHPSFENVWLVGGGSGHGFKHGPALGEYVAKKVINGEDVEPFFKLSSKGKVEAPSIFHR